MGGMEDYFVGGLLYVTEGLQIPLKGKKILDHHVIVRNDHLKFSPDNGSS